MIIDSIIIENFGVYAGKQEVALTPSPGKPIILFGGLNGGGKTTLLDAVQLAFYGSKAKLASRGKLAYKKYLRESINHKSDPTEGAAVTVFFNRIMDGEKNNFQIRRSWFERESAIEEDLRVLIDGETDSFYTEHWEEYIENYLPSGVAHLFFFDGEQIEELAEVENSSRILETAIHSLLGLDLIERLQVDLKNYERRKKTDTHDPKIINELEHIRESISQIEQEEEELAMKEGRLVNESEYHQKQLKIQEERFRLEGGEIYQNRHKLNNEELKLKNEKFEKESQLRSLASGSLPLLMLEEELNKIEKLAQHENKIRHARTFSESIKNRDNEVLRVLKKEKIADSSYSAINKYLKKDRDVNLELANEELLLDAPENLPHQVEHLYNEILPSLKKEANELVKNILNIDESLARTENEILRIPSDEKINDLQEELDQISKVYKEKFNELDDLRVKQKVLQRQKSQLLNKLDNVGDEQLNIKFDEDDRLRTLKHSKKVRNTLGKFRTAVVKNHLHNIENLMLESFQSLLRKTELIDQLKIEPTTFKTTLTDKNGNTVPFKRLSAGERQLLATSLLWGLARSSGRPIPTIIDTPLGRLDSSHRKHFIEKYFPSASHQVLLLSTDEEIVGPYFEKLKPFVSRTFLMVHDENSGKTHFEKGYFG